jgi:hypothetical protein
VAVARRIAAPLLAIALVLATLAGLFQIARTEIVGQAQTRASDALPLYLSGAAVAAGLDPTREASLARIYDERGLSVGAATFSTLYPATAGEVMQGLAARAWPDFTTTWRWILLGAIGGYALAAGWAAPGGGMTRITWGGAVGALLAWHPVSAECVRLGQVNMVLGALCSVAMAAVTAAGRRGAGGEGRTWASDLVCGAALGLGAAVKLVPAALLLPLWATRRWRPTLGAAVVGGAALLLVLPIVPLSRVIEAIRETLRFQAAIDPDWLVGQHPAPGWMRVFGYIRHDALQWITLGTAAVVPFARPSTRVATAAMALVCAWLGADAAGFHVLYTPLAYPVFVLAVGRPLALGVLAAALYLLPLAPGLTPEPRMVLFGLVAWGVAAETLARAARAVPAGVVEADPELRQAALATAGVLTGVLLVGAMPGDGPLAPPLPEGRTTPEGAGFIHPNDRVPGTTSGAGAGLGSGLDRAASTLAKPGTVRAVQLYMRRAPVAWKALAEQYPARTSLLTGRADAAPAGDLRDHSGREIATWLRAEQATVEGLTAEGLDLGELPAALQAALASGLADPGLEAPNEVP